MTAAGHLYDDFLESADIAAALLADPAVAGSWDKPSALAEFSVRGLAGHLARQVLIASELLAAPLPAGECIPVMEHFARARWVGAGVDAEISVAIRRDSEDIAAAGADELARRVTAAVVELSGILPRQSADRLVNPPGASWLLTLPDFLLTRLMEIAVHCDDLAVSVGVACPPLPTRAMDTVLGLLTRLAQQRHGATAVLRALSRAERAPAAIAAF